jgi:fructoselysine-6-P-deglycase FrlB-like protein
MTRFLHDILRQPEELEGGIAYLCDGDRPLLDEAAEGVRNDRHVYLTGIGSSWHTALNAGAFFHSGGYPVHMRDAAELLHFDTLPEDPVIIITSRTGRSPEIVNLLPKARKVRATVIGVTNSYSAGVAVPNRHHPGAACGGAFGGAFRGGLRFFLYLSLHC